MGQKYFTVVFCSTDWGERLAPGADLVELVVGAVSLRTVQVAVHREGRVESRTLRSGETRSQILDPKVEHVTLVGAEAPGRQVLAFTFDGKRGRGPWIGTECECSHGLPTAPAAPARERGDIPGACDRPSTVEASGALDLQLTADVSELQQEAFDLLVLMLDELNRGQWLVPYLVLGEIQRDRWTVK